MREDMTVTDFELYSQKIEREVVFKEKLTKN